MRNLTIERRKSFVASLCAFKVYIEDPYGDVTMQDTHCRLLGKLKNGEIVTFPVGEEATRLFVIADKLSQGYCCEVYQLPAGNEDISLAGQCLYNPAHGNAFRFDGATAEETANMRKKNTRTGLIVLTCSLLIGILLGVGAVLIPRLINANPKTFSEAGLTITLPGNFRKVRNDTATVSYSHGDTVVFAIKETYAETPFLESLTLKEFGDAGREVYGEYLPTALVQEDGLTYFTYKATIEGDSYTYLVLLFKTTDAFWQVQLACPTKEYSETFPDFMEWAKTIHFE